MRQAGEMADYPAAVAQSLLTRMEDLLSPGGRILLGLAGPPGAGKTTLAQLLLRHFGDRAVVVPMDGFHLSNLQLRRLGRADRKGAPDTFDAEGYISLLQRIRAQGDGATIYAPQFHREIEESFAAEIAIDPQTQLVITEGNYLLLDRDGWQDVRSVLDQTWYVQLESGERQTRLIARHKSYGRSEVEARTWVQATDEPNARLIEAGRSRADYIVVNTAAGFAADAE